MDISGSPLPANYEDMLHAVFDQSAQGFQVINTEWRYLFVNSTVARQGREPVSNLIGRSMMEVYPGIDKTPLFEQLKRAMNDRLSIRMENEFKYPDGSTGWFQLFIHPWSDGIVIFSTDITDRKKDELFLKNKVEELSAKADSSEAEQKTIEDLKAVVSKLNSSEPTVI